MRRFHPTFWAAALLPLTGCHGLEDIADNAIMGTGPVKTESRKVDSFTKVKIQHALEADIEIGDKTSVSVEANENLLPLVTVKVDGDELVLSTDQSISSKTPIKIHIVTPSLTGLDASGATTVVATSLKETTFTLKASGASNVDLSGDFGALSTDISGASRAKLKGTATDGNLHAAGASQVDVLALKIGQATAEASGASTVRLGPAETLDAEADGASTISYQGKPKIVRNESSGASTIEGAN